MFLPKACFCRVFQTAFRIALPFLPYRDPKVLHTLSELEPIFNIEKIHSVLVVTDRGIRSHGLVLPLEETLQRCGISYIIYDETQPNPTVANVEDAVSLYHAHRCDALIALGGGSAMDCAKAVGARIVYPKKTVKQMGGILRVLRKLPPLIAIPTTAGTGSETTLAAVISEPAARHKYALMSFPLIPHYAVLDASLTYSLPPHLTATTGMDALTHAVEAYIGRSTTKKTRALALEATALIFQNIETAYQESHNHEAKENMLLAANKAGTAFSMSYVGYIHAIAHSLGGHYGTPHGLATAVTMPFVLEAYGSCVYKKLHELGIAAGVSSKEDSHTLGALRFIAAIKDLNARLGIPATLTEIRKEDIPHMAQQAEHEANPLYPVPALFTAQELEMFYYKLADRRVCVDIRKDTAPVKTATGVL